MGRARSILSSTPDGGRSTSVSDADPLLDYETEAARRRRRRSGLRPRRRPLIDGKRLSRPDLETAFSGSAARRRGPVGAIADPDAGDGDPATCLRLGGRGRRFHGRHARRAPAARPGRRRWPSVKSDPGARWLSVVGPGGHRRMASRAPDGCAWHARRPAPRATRRDKRHGGYAPPAAHHDRQFGHGHLASRR